MEESLELENLAKQLKEEIDTLSKSLASLEKEISLLQRGDDSGSYWKGKNAYSSIEKCLNQIDSNRNLIDNLKKCSLYLDSLVQK